MQLTSRWFFILFDVDKFGVRAFANTIALKQENASPCPTYLRCTIPTRFKLQAEARKRATSSEAKWLGAKNSCRVIMFSHLSPREGAFRRS